MNKVLKYYIITYVGFIACAHALRMIYEGLFTTNYYRPCGFDLYFDWGIMLVLGLVLIVIGLPRLYQKITRRSCRTCRYVTFHCNYYAKKIIESDHHCPAWVDSDAKRKQHL